MTDEEKDKAKGILVKPVRTWTKSEHAFIYALTKKGLRDELKILRSEALMA